MRASLPDVIRVGLRSGRVLLPLAVLGLCVYLMGGVVRGLDTTMLMANWRAISAWQWGMALTTTAVSFLAISQYDVLAHRHLRTDCDPSRAARSGLVAVALSQTLGMGVLTATLARWRMQAGQGLGLAAAITAFSSAVFMLSLVAIAAVAVLLLPGPPGLNMAAGLILVALALLALCLVRNPQVTVAGRGFDLPPLRVGLQALGWAMLDLTAAAATLWILFPNGTAPEFIALLPVFLMALLLGVAAGTPGGLGPFELIMLSMTVPGHPAAAPPEAVLIAIAGYRLVFFLLPAGLAMMALLATYRRA